MPFKAISKSHETFPLRMTFFSAGDCEPGQGDGRRRSEGGGHRGGERGGPDLPSYSPGFYLFYFFNFFKLIRQGLKHCQIQIPNKISFLYVAMYKHMCQVIATLRGRWETVHMSRSNLSQ